MTENSGSMPQDRQTGNTSLGKLILALVVIAIASGAYLMSRKDETPVSFDMARSALLTAQQRLSESYSHEAALVEQLQTAHQQLNQAIEQLEAAEELDPQDKNEIEDLRLGLKALEDPNRLAHTSVDELKTSYHDLSAKLDALILKLETPKQ